MTKKIVVDPSHAFLERPQHPLTPFFNPKSVAVIGATHTPHSVGNTLMHNLDTGEFAGNLYPVNPKYDTLCNRTCFPTVDAIADPVDLAIIVTPAKTVPNIIDQCAKKGIRAAIIISAGFKELGQEGLALERQVLEHARQGGIRIVGPNCLGIMNPLAGFNGTFAASMAFKGNIAFISQSGAMCTAVLDWSLKEKIGFSTFVSIGSMADVNWGDLIDYLGSDPSTDSILIYMESVGNAQDFLSAAREVVLSKPIIVIKAGRTQAAAKAAASHTGSLAGSDEVFDAAMIRCGVLRVDEIGELFYMAETLAKQPTPSGPNLAILTNAGGPAVLATDAAVGAGARIAQLTSETIDALDRFLPQAWSHSNPVDLLGDAGPDRYAQALRIVAQDPCTDGILVILSPQDMTDVVGTAKNLAHLAQIQGKPLLASWMGGQVIEAGIQELNQAGIPSFIYPDSASKTFASMWRQNYALQALYEIPESRGDPSLVQERTQKTEAVFQKALSQGRTLLTEDESKQVLAYYDIPVVPTRVARSAEEAAATATAIGYPVVLKLHSETITHKTDVGGVLLDLHTEEEVTRGFAAIQASVSEKAGEEHFQGVSVQKMVKLQGYEIILGSMIDAQFGPVILFGSGGQLVEVYKDRALGLPPLNANLARRMMDRTKIYQALKGVRGRSPIDFAQLEQILIAFSELAISHPNLAECDINPLIASDKEIITLDARIVLSKEPVVQPVIRPYPIKYLSVWNGITLRPVRPEDEPLFEAFHRALSPQTVRARYFRQMTLKERTRHERMIRICHADYNREILLCALKEGQILGVVHLQKAPRSKQGILHLIVIDRMQRQGLGTKLLSEAIEIASKEGINRLEVHMLADNEAMKKMVVRQGFTLTPSKKNPDILLAHLNVERLDTH